MPHIQVTLLKGRSTEQKRRIAERMTQVLAEEAKTDRDSLVKRPPLRLGGRSFE